MRTVLLLVALVMAGTAQAAMLCARPRSDGTFSTTVKLREACRPSEVELGIVTLQPLRLFGPTTTTSTSTSTSSTTSTTTLDQNLTYSFPSLGLMVELKRNDDGVPNYADPHDFDNVYTWTDPGDSDNTNADGTMWTDFLVKLNTPPCFAGHCDWRIPTTSELDSTNVFHGYPSPYPYPSWSSNTWSGIPTDAALEGLTDGPSPEPKVNSHVVRAVRNLP